MKNSSSTNDVSNILPSKAHNVDFSVWILGALAVGIYITLSWFLNIWIDEAFTLQTTGKDLRYAVQQAMRFESQPPVYFILLTVWRKISPSPFVARLFSIICIIFSLLVTLKLSQRFLKKTNYVWVFLIVAFNPFTIWAATEIRLYSLVVLLSSTLILSFYEGYISEVPKRKARWFYLIFAILSLYTQYYLGFILFANACILLILKKWKAFIEYSFIITLTGLLFSPMIITVYNQINTVNSSTTHNLNFSIISNFKVIIWNIMRFILPTTGNNLLDLLRTWIIRIAIVVSLTTTIKKYRISVSNENISLITIFLVSFIFIMMISIRFGTSIIMIHHISLLFIPTIFISLSILQMTYSNKIFISWIIIALFFYAIALINTYGTMEKPGDWIRVASYIMNNEKPNEPILVFRSEFILPLKTYYNGVNKIIPIPSEPNLEKYDLSSQVLSSTEQIQQPLIATVDRTRRFWLITLPNHPFRGVDFHPEILEKFVDLNCAILEEVNFSPTKIRLLYFK